MTNPIASSPPEHGKTNVDGSKSKSSNISQRRFEFLFAPNLAETLTPLATSQIAKTLDSMEEVRVLHRIKPVNLSTFGSGDQPVLGDLVVAEMTWERALELQATTGKHVVMERNWELQHLGAFMPTFVGTGVVLTPVALPTTSVQFKVQGEAGEPLARAQVIVYGSGFPVQAETDENGSATVSIYGPITTGIAAVYVKPFADYWEAFIPHPSLKSDESNTIALEPLSAFPPAHFPGAPYIGWGQRILGLDEDIVAKYSGRGVRIGIIDSGCDTQHPALTHINNGLDYTDPDPTAEPNPQSWTVDTLSHGTHCAGVIAGNGEKGIRGFAPDAEVHILKLFPGGRFDDLIKALKYCMDNKIDVVNCSLGSPQGSSLVSHWLELARQAGIAVVVAAGNSGGPVQFPALLPNVLCVSAMGQDGNFPDGTYHRETEPGAIPGVIGVNGIFAPKFTCFGPEVKVCGPGVAIISSVPGGGYAAWDGTSMAAPHISGVLGLVAAHHPVISRMPRDANRVDRLFQTVIGSAMSIGLDQAHGGAGVPSVGRALSYSARPAGLIAPAVGPLGAAQLMPADLARIIGAVIAEVQTFRSNAGRWA